MRWALPLILALLLAACGQQAGQQPSGDQGQQPEAGGTTLVWGRSGDSVILDPIQATDGESFKVTHQIFDTLVEYAPGTTEVVPHLAERWETSPDGLVWTFYLRQGVKFHDGTPFNAEAVKFNFDRWRDESNPYHKGGTFEYYAYMFGGFGDKSVIQEVKVVDEYTVQFILRAPQAPFLSNLAMVPFAIASPTAVMKDPEGFGQQPVGTGPFVFKEWQKGDRIVLEANPDYWGGKPKVDRVVFRSIPDNNARLLALQSGDLDIMDGLNPSDVARVKDAYQIAMRPAMNVGYLAMNVTKAPFDDVRVRMAINHAINKQELIDSFYAGLAQPAKNPMPPSMWGYNDQVKDYPFDPEKAKQLLAEAGWKDNDGDGFVDKDGVRFTTELWAMPVARPYMPEPQKIAVAILGYLKKIGIDAKIVSYDWGTYLDKTANGEHPMALLGWIGDNGDPDNFLYVLLDCDNAKPPAGNIAFYCNQEVHDLLIQAQQSADINQRTQNYMRAQELIKADAPWVPLVHAQEPIVLVKGVQGYVPSPTGSEQLTNVTVSR